MDLLLQIISASLIGSIVFYWRGAMGVGGFLNAQYINRLREYELKYLKYARMLTDEAKTGDEKFIIPSGVKNDREEAKSIYKKNVTAHYLFALLLIFVLLFLAQLTDQSHVLLIDKMLYGFIGILFLIITMFVAHVQVVTMKKLDAKFEKLEQELDNLSNQQTIET